MFLPRDGIARAGHAVSETAKIRTETVVTTVAVLATSKRINPQPKAPRIQSVDPADRRRESASKWVSQMSRICRLATASWSSAAVGCEHEKPLSEIAEIHTPALAGPSSPDAPSGANGNMARGNRGNRANFKNLDGMGIGCNRAARVGNRGNRANPGRRRRQSPPAPPSTITVSFSGSSSRTTSMVRRSGQTNSGSSSCIRPWKRSTWERPQ
jgi:hypothetical protein